jgi:hypothetical protein
MNWTALQKSADFLKIIKNRWYQIDLNLKIAEFTIYDFKISEKDEINKIYVKIHCSFGRFIDKISWYSSVGDFSIHIFNQMDFDLFLLNSSGFFKNQRNG